MEYTCTHNHQSQFIEWFGNVTETTSLSSLIAESYPGEWGKEAKNNNGVKVLRTTNFQNNGHIDYSDVIVRYIEQKKIEKKCLRTGDIILERSGGTKDNPVGRVVLFEAEGEYMFNNFTQLLRPIKSVNPYYLFFYLHTSYNADKASMRAMASQTTGIQNLNMTDYMAKEIPLPSLEEQEQFERLYRQADKSKFDGFKSQFLEQFRKDVTRKELSSLCDTFIDGDWIESKDQSESGIRLIQTGNVGSGVFVDKEDKARYINEETFSRLNCTAIESGDILISRLPDPVGRACIIPKGIGKAITAVDCSIIRTNKEILPEFLIGYTLTDDYQSQIKACLSGTTRLRISRSNLGKIKIPVPDLDDQQQFVVITQQADKSKFELKRAIEAIDKVIKSLING